MNRGHEGSTNPEQIPPTHVLVAAQEQDRKETEDLLSGFDRPGRGPKLPAPERDFVDYYAKKKDGSPVSDRNANARPNTSPMPPGVRPAPPKPKQANISTVVVPRTKPLPPWMTWSGVALVMLLIGGAVAYLASRDDASTKGTAATTTSSITSAPPSLLSSRDDIPPPPPLSDVDPSLTASPPDPVPAAPVSTAPTPTSRASGKRPSSSSASAAASPPPATAAPPPATPATSSKAPPRDDFIRDMGAPK